MAAAGDATTISIRLPEAMYRASRQLAKRRGISLNALVRDGLAALLKAEEEKRFFDSFSLLGQDVDECDVEYAATAQGEVMLRDEAPE